MTADQLTQLQDVQRDWNGQMLYIVKIMLSPFVLGLAGKGTIIRLRQTRLWLRNTYIKAADDNSKPSHLEGGSVSHWRQDYPEERR